MTKDRSKIHANYKDRWETPPELFAALDREFRFVLDAAASKENALCRTYITKEGDSLATDWGSIVRDRTPGGAIWLNPPYGRGIGCWVRQAFETAEDGATVVCLLPANTDTRWFHDYVLGKRLSPLGEKARTLGADEIRWLSGRVQFLIDGEKPTGSGNPGGSVIAIYRGK